MNTVKPLILAALNYSGWSYEIILVPALNFGVFACSIIEYSRPVILTNLLRSRNKGHAKI